MKYIFVINGRSDKSIFREEIQGQIDEFCPGAMQYYTIGVGDGTRFVRSYCEFHQKEEVCFVACGGSGTFNEVASGLIGYENKSVAILAYGTTNDFTKYYPGRNHRSLRDIVENGETVQIDAIRCNDDYAFNVINIGFDSRAAYETNLYLEAGVKYGYQRGVSKSIFTSRFNNFRITVDGERITKGLTLLCTVSNAQYCGGSFRCAPRAKVDDGLMDICLIRGVSLLGFLMILPKFIKGTHLDNKFCMRRMVYRQARKVEFSSKNLTYISNDGEILASDHFDFEIIDKAVTLRLPCLKKEDAQ